MNTALTAHVLVVVSLAVGASMACGGIATEGTGHPVKGTSGGSAGSSSSDGSGGSMGSGGSTGSSGGPGGSTGTGGVAGTGGSGHACGHIRVRDFDTSCTKNSDCVVVYTGRICPGDCPCFVGNDDAINRSSEAEYQAAVASVDPHPSVCSCYLTIPRCVASRCIACMGISGGGAYCPDAGAGH